MDSRLRLLKLLLWFVAASHFVVGLGALLSPGLRTAIASLYGAEVPWTPALHYVAGALGAFMVGIGIVAAAAATDPVRYRAVVLAVAVVLLLRVGQRLVLMEQIQSVFSVGGGRLLLNAAFFGVLSISLLVLLRGLPRTPDAWGAPDAWRAPGA